MKEGVAAIQHKLLEGTSTHADRLGSNTGFLLKKKDTGLQIAHSFGATISRCALSNTVTPVWTIPKVKINQ